MGRAYYNEIDPAAAHILRAMISNGVIAPGDVDTRPIQEVSIDDLRGYTQCHFFAGGGLWSVALRLAGWPDDRPIYTGSCPCQPFSNAGKGLGTDDPRHLWPHFHRLIRAGRPPVIMGEQVASKAGRHWFHGVRADLEAGGYAGRAVDFPACSVDAPHQRNRLYWIAVEHAASERRGERWPEHELRSGRPAFAGADASGDVADCIGSEGGSRESGSSCCSTAESERSNRSHTGSKPSYSYGLDQGVTQGDAFSPRLEGQRWDGDGSGGPEPHRPVATANGCERDISSDADSHRCDREGIPARSQWQRGVGTPGDHEGICADADRGGCAGRPEVALGIAFERKASQRPVLRNGTYWSDAEWIVCHDEKARRAKSGVCDVAHGFSRGMDANGDHRDPRVQGQETLDYGFLVRDMIGRVDLWKVAGNAIVPEAAAEVIAAFMDEYGVPVLPKEMEAA